jgi:hypothetical protein
MPAASTTATTVFVLIVLVVVVLFVSTARTAFAHHARADRARSSGLVFTLGVLVASIVIPGGLARAGLLDHYAPLPAPALVLVAAITLGTIVLALSSFGARVVAAIPLTALVGYQTFRVAVEWVLHRLYLEGAVPVQMTYAGRNFDVFTGLGAVVLVIVLASGRPVRGLVLVWNMVGLGLLANIVTIAVLSTPVPFRHFTDDPPNLLPSTFPFVWLPTFLVQAALFGHLVVFRALAARDRWSRP